MMTWQEFCDYRRVPKRYQLADINNLSIPNDENGDSFARKAISFIKCPRSLFLVGGIGVGKTHFSYALMRGLIEFEGSSMMDVYPVRAFDIFDREFDDLINCDYLFIDDLGWERNVFYSNIFKHKELCDFYYNLLDIRYSNEKFTIISSFIHPSETQNYLESRITHQLKEFTILEFNGPDLRGE